MNVLKKDGTQEPFDESKIITAINKAAERVLETIDDQQMKSICSQVKAHISDNPVSVEQMHNIVETVLDSYNAAVAKSYREYRNYKKDFIHILDDVYQKAQSIMYLGDKENANTDSALVATKRSLIFNQLNKELYQKFNLNSAELQACKDGYIYIHDMSARRDTMNCCLFDVASVLTGGFEMGNLWYNEPKSLDTAFDVIGDIILSTAAQQYGGFTVPEIDKILEPYAEKSYQKYVKEYQSIVQDPSVTSSNSDRYAVEKVHREFEQGFQGLEYKLNSVGSSRGDYPFVTITFGLATSRFGKMASITALDVHRKGQGKEGNKKPTLFPKLVFLYDENLHGEGKPLEDVFEAGVKCSSKTMYPDWLSLTGEGYVPEMYKRYGRVVSPMGCRAFLSPWYERGGINPADENDKPVFVGRFNIGAISLHLPMILAKSRQEGKDFYEVLDYYLEMIRNLHKKTYDYLGELKASVNPMAYCQGGFYGGHLKPHERIRPLLKSSTASFGITALNELQELYNGKSIAEDGNFALEVLKYINAKTQEFKAEDGILYAMYGTPAENLCFTGDTLVQTYDGDKQIKDITTGDLVYSFNADAHKVELKRVLASKKTMKDAELVEVLFDNGQTIRCTPNHKFGIRRTNCDSTTHKFVGKEQLVWVAAKDLVKGDRVKSNYITINPHGRPECSIYHNGRKQLIQDIHAEFNMGAKPSGYVTHHIDQDKTNNLFGNLKYLSSSKHRKLHVKDNILPFQYTSENQTGVKNGFYGKKHTAEANQKNREAHMGRSIDVVDEFMNHVAHYECIGDAEKSGYTRRYIKQCCNGCKNHKYKNLYWFYTEDYQNIVEENHKVVSVVTLPYKEDVYDIEVEDNHNFFVGGHQGILVHNCGLQIKQFRKKYGIVHNVSDRPYVSNSFHCHVTEDITPIEKQDLEGRFWNYINGGKIQYVRYPIDYNIEAIKSLIRRAMKMGFYEGVNLSLAYCEDCGYQELDMDVCPKCGSSNLTKIDRMNGYLAYSRVHGDTRLNAAKMAEISERKSM